MLLQHGLFLTSMPFLFVVVVFVVGVFHSVDGGSPGSGHTGECCVVVCLFLGISNVNYGILECITSMVHYTYIVSC